MNKEAIKPILKKGMYAALIFDGLLLLYMFITGNLFGELYGTEILLFLAYFVIFTDMVAAIWNLVIAIQTKEYKLFGISLGYIGAAGILFVLILILAIASINL